eukprot:TRINITY_DN14364_c0_g1_i1.p1 TRINITY_DN14364_c0_g1~~TRINITY_DN14364_c0_g1_i1.p1  ORF type:complete len:607 (+),score=147.24 TRINITY_DN14364_c0_g1_i1:521-2341(+)
MGSRCSCGEIVGKNKAIIPAKDGGFESFGNRDNDGFGHQKEGQRRADLMVKEGGFALGAFMATNPGKIGDFFLFEKKVIGEGGFGSVVRAKDKRTNQWHAVKKIRKPAKSAADRKLKEEIEIMRLLDHPHIVRLVESFEDRRTIYLVMELCEGGELFDRLSRGALTERIASTCIRHMLLAVNYLHQNLIVHRDLKPENWLLASKEEVGVAPLKLIDFGISARFQAGVPLKTKVGTPGYTAPEVLAGRYNQAVDVWSLGVIMFITLSGQMPFVGKNLEQILNKVKAASYSMDGSAWRRVSEQAKSVVRVFLQKMPSSRPTAAQALQMPWLQPDKQDGTNALESLDVDALKNFANMHKLKRAALTVIATQMSGAGIDALKNMFLSMDANADGTISTSELRTALKAAKLDVPDDLVELLEHVDTDGSGVLDYTEFLAASLDKKIYHQEDVVWAAFKKFDADNSGFIDKKELAKVLGDDAVLDAMHVDGAAVQSIFEKVDANGDGVIDFEEFFAMMRAAETTEPVAKPPTRVSFGPGVGGASPRLGDGRRQRSSSGPGASPRMGSPRRRSKSATAENGPASPGVSPGGRSPRKGTRRTSRDAQSIGIGMA